MRRKCVKILVCIKQVPDTTEIKIDEVTNTLIREGVPSIVNPFDKYALETAARIKDERGAEIVVISMGPQQAKSALKECLSTGADKAYLVSDRMFSGSDTLATGYILSKAIKTVEEKEGVFDMILCGLQAIDGDTAQTGPQLAEHLNYPQITCVSKILECESGIKVQRETDTGKEIIESSLPVVITITKTEYEPRFPTIKSKMAASKAKIDILTINEINADPEKSGLTGSPTRVKKTFVPVRNKNSIIINESSARASASMLAGLLNDAGLV